MDITTLIATLRSDYHRFPDNPTFSIYAEEVYFKDPLTEFRGLRQYQQMIGFMQRWFQAVRLELHDLTAEFPLITTHWTLSWITPLPWRPRIHISGRSELVLNEAGLIASHIDYWDCSVLNVLRQHFSWPQKKAG